MQAYPILAHQSPAAIRKYISSVCDYLELMPTQLAKAAGLAPSTLNKFLADPSFPTCLSSRTLAKINTFVARSPRALIAGALPSVSADSIQSSLDGASGSVERFDGEDLSAKLDSLSHSFRSISVRVIGALEANAWRTTMQWPEKKQYMAPMALRGVPDTRKIFAYEVNGDIASDVYPSGSVLACLSLGDLGRELLDGEHVIVQRVRGDGKTEGTVRELQITGNQRLLVTRSRKPQFRSVIPLPASDTSVIAVVVGAFITQPHFR